MHQLLSDVKNMIKNKRLPFSLGIQHADINDIFFDNQKEKSLLHIQRLFIHTQFDDHTRDANFLIQIKKPRSVFFQITLHGNPADYSLSAQLKGYRSNWMLQGHGDDKTLTLHTTQNAFLGGSLAATLQVTQKNPWQWIGEIHARQLHLSILDPYWSDPFSLNVKSENDSQVAATSIEVHSPYGHLQFDFQHRRTWHTEWTVQLQHLSHWMPNTEGFINSTGHIKGDLLNPTIKIKVDGKIHSPQWHLHHLKIKLDGTLHDHELISQWNFPKQTINAVIRGSFENHTWKGGLRTFTINIENNGQWKLKNPTDFFISNHIFQMSSFCLTDHNAGYFCAIANLNDARWSGNIKASITQFQWLKIFIPAINISQGKFLANIAISGTQKKPHVTGSMSLQQGSIQIPTLNITLTQASASIAEKRGKLHIDAKAFSQKKPIAIDGVLDVSTPHIHLQASMTSDDALLMNTSEYAINMTSQLLLNIQGDNIFLSGELTIPTANLKPYDFKTTTTLPENDIVFIGEKIHPPKPVWFVHSNVTIHLGKQVNIDAGGLKATLGGSLQLISEPNQNMTANGEIFVRQGTFSVYGKLLTVEKDSYISYANGLLNNPSLNIRASKNINTYNSFDGSGAVQGKIMVGIAVTGEFKEPKFIFYSNRGNMSQADILSYLLFGYGTSTGSAGDTDLLLSALSTAGITSQGILGKQNIASQIESGLGLSELGMESNSTIDGFGNPLDNNSSFVVGKHVSKRVYARYSFGMLNPQIDVFELRYLLDHHWALQGDSSTLGNGADIMWTMEK